MRSAEFDREKVLRSAMNAFMNKGYSKTSMQDLKQATGLHPGSIYCAFENKRGLLLAALEQYKSDRSSEFFAMFDHNKPVFSGIEAYIANLVEECESEQVQDCLLQKALSELAHQDDEVAQVISDMLNAWHNALADKLRKAEENKEIAAGRNIEDLAQFLVMGIYGIRTFAHTNPKKGSLKRLSGDLLNYIRGH